MCAILKRSWWLAMFVLIFIAIPALAQDQPKSGRTTDPHAVMSTYLSTQITSPENQGGPNFNRWNDPETHRLIVEAGSIPDWPKRKELYCKAAALTFEGISRIYLYQRMNLHAYRDRLQGWIPTSWGTIGWNAQDWWVKQ